MSYDSYGHKLPPPCLLCTSGSKCAECSAEDERARRILAMFAGAVDKAKKPVKR